MRAKSWLFTDKTKHYGKKGIIKKNILKQFGMNEIAREYMYNAARVLDFGCGSCVFFDNLRDSKKHNSLPLYPEAEYHAYDIDREALKIAESKGYKAFNNIKKLDRNYDIIFMNSVIEHLKSDDAIKIFGYLSKKLRKGGYLIIDTINPSELFSNLSFWDDAEHEKMYSLKSLKKLGDQNKLILHKVYKHHIRLNPFKFLIDLITGDIYCGFTVVLIKE